MVAVNGHTCRENIGLPTKLGEMNFDMRKCCYCCRTLSARRIHHSITRALGPSVGTTIGMATALIISNYHPVHWKESGDGPPGLPKVMVRIIEYKFTDTQVPQWIKQPSPTIFTISWAVFALTSLTLHHTFRDVQNRDRVLLAVCGGGMGLLLMLCNKSFLDALGIYLPCLVQAGLFLVMTLHGWQLNLEDEGMDNEAAEDAEKDALECGEVGWSDVKIVVGNERI
ncbi:hypothetical protein AJ78_00215 [Emergomyces pasteurianus Ep9510]|uniref:Uncharacterized protein n=1 Tax=Emergomyces pasteurianus Ep9510 TaxID=1447872 RepID=A0A1J9QUH2_9EURO|nr:hypothetical protein AJ78_00215 [Emergomyces pasteurianus Ep9510]